MAIHMHIFAYIHTHPQRFKYTHQVTNILTCSHISTYINTFYTFANIHMSIAFTHIHKTPHVNTYLRIFTYSYTLKYISHTTDLS